MLEFLLLAVSIFVAIAAVILGFALSPWFFLSMLLLAPLTAVIFLRSQPDGEGSILDEVTLLVALGFIALLVLVVGLGILLHPLFFLLLLLLVGLLAAQLWFTSQPDTQ